jgi:transposase
MEHLAIDLGGRESQVCVRGADGTILEEKRWATRDLERYMSTRPHSRVLVETCAEAFFVADRARTLGHEVRVVPGTLVRTLGVGERKTKTDKRDARKLSEVSTRIDVPSVHVPSQESRELKTRLGMRVGLVTARTQLINTVRGWLRTHLISVPKNADRFVARVRGLIVERPVYVERQLTAIESLTQQIDETDQEVKALANKHAVCPRLMSVPGVGPVTALQFVAVVDDVSRFKSAHDLEAYLGVTPGIYASSTRVERTGITKAGSSELRRVLTQAAWSARRARGRHPMLEWAAEVEKRRGKRIAVIALVRKIVGILFALWRDGTLYDPMQAARSDPFATR